jgi:hypothetical protein
MESRNAQWHCTATGVVSQFGVGQQQRGRAQTAEFKQRFPN